MKKIFLALAAACTLFWGADVALAQREELKAPIASKPPIEIRGRITKVGLAFGQGMPSLEVKANSGETWKVWLGSMRYLVQQDFNPKAGQEVTVKGFQPADANELYAATVSLVEADKTIRLRDERGWPVWSQGRGPWRGGRHGPPAGRRGPPPRD